MRARWRAAPAVLVPYVVSRVLVVASLAITRHLFTTLGVARPLAARDGLLGWDASWYRDIARGGYDAVPVEGLRFFPLFPLLGRAVAWLPGVDAGLGVLVVANLSALALGFAVYELVALERDDDVARRAMWVLFLAPPAFVLTMAYAEAPFLLATTIAFIALRSERWWIAAVAGVVAALTRPVGLLLAIPAAVEGWRRRDARAIVPAVAPAAGLLAFLVWARDRGDGFLYPLRVQQDPVRRGEWVDPFRAIAHSVDELFTGDHVSAGVHAAAAIVFAGLLVVLARRWPLSFTLYAAGSLVVALSSKNLDSLERYGFAAVPFVLAGADVLETPDRERLVLSLEAAGLVGAAVLAFSGVMVP
jgi:hypothetical protein